MIETPRGTQRVRDSSARALQCSRGAARAPRRTCSSVSSGSAASSGWLALSVSRPPLSLSVYAARGGRAGARARRVAAGHVSPHPAQKRLRGAARASDEQRDTHPGGGRRGAPSSSPRQYAAPAHCARTAAEDGRVRARPERAMKKWKVRGAGYCWHATRRANRPLLDACSAHNDETHERGQGVGGGHGERARAARVIIRDARLDRQRALRVGLRV